MGRIDEAIEHIKGIEDGTERAFQMSGLVSTLFKLKGVTMIVTGQLAFEIYANAVSDRPAVELSLFSGNPAPRALLDIMRGQLQAKGGLGRWTVAGIPIRLLGSAHITYPNLCRDFTTEHGIVKLMPAEEVTVECILASVHPEPDFEAQTRARLLLINGLTEAFQMDWQTLQKLCDLPDYRVGEELARMRASAKKDVDVMSSAPDHIGQAVQTPAPPPLSSPKPRAVRYPLVDDDPSAVI